MSVNSFAKLPLSLSSGEFLDDNITCDNDNLQEYSRGKAEHFDDRSVNTFSAKLNKSSMKYSSYADICSVYSEDYCLESKNTISNKSVDTDLTILTEEKDLLCSDKEAEKDIETGSAFEEHSLDSSFEKSRDFDF